MAHGRGLLSDLQTERRSLDLVDMDDYADVMAELIGSFRPRVPLPAEADVAGFTRDLQ